LMVALLISTILLLGVLELFGSSSKTSRSATALARMQENGRLAMDLIAREARRTGFYGCDNGVVDSGNVNFGAAGGGDISFPDESLRDSSDDSLALRYFGTSDGISATNCERSQLPRYYIHFRNCGQNLCVESVTCSGASCPGSANRQVLLNHAKIEKVLFIQPCENDATRSCTYNINQLPRLGTPPETSFSAVQKIQVELELCTDTLNESSNRYCAADSNTRITRKFSSLIELRNRL